MTATRTPYTTTTWASLDSHLEQGKRFPTWEHEFDLTCELVALAPHLTQKQADILISAVTGTRPVVLTWARGGARDVRTTVIVEELCAPVGGQPGSIRVAYWGGFSHSVYLNQIIAVETPGYEIL